MSAKSILTLSLVCLLQVPLAQAQQSEKPVSFALQIKPILSDKCFACHGPDASHREADLRLDVERDAKADLGDYAAIVAGDPDESELMVRIRSTDEYEVMPPPEMGKELSEKEIKLIEQWIREGAKWEQHWAYEQPKRSTIPEVNHAEWPSNWIDHFVLSRLESKGWSPNKDADRITLIRRVYFDLIGIPPTPEEVKAFLADESDDAFEKVVDRLLASDHFGERLAMYWLDLVRYADTVGYHGDQDHNISPYRDWVIAALNDNMPFDQFTREQLAGDLLENPTIDQKIATGYNRLLQTSHEGGVQPGEYLTIYAADRVRNISLVWMGATIGCAQCHDHKYDPYTMGDFYSIAAFFADVDEAQHFKVGTNSLPTARPPEIEVLTSLDRKKIQQLEEEASRVDGKELDALRQQISQIKDHPRATMITVSLESPREVRVLPRGNWLDNSGEVVQPAIPKLLGQLDAGQERATRMDLANWLTDPDDGVGYLTARVMVNRFWYLLLGGGLAPSLDDFGGQGITPEDVLLLDNLAIDFVENSWDVKHLYKSIVMSRTYRQSSLPSDEMLKADPDNRYFGRQARYRLPAELVRDQALAISDLLIREIGGASVKPYQPAGHYRHLNFPERKYSADKDENQWRRGLYVHWQRQFLHPALKTLDAPMREECTAARPRSNTPSAALTLLNDPSYVEAARCFARKIIEQGPEDVDSRASFAFQWAVSREPDAEELRLLTDLYQSMKKQYQDDPDSARELLSVGQAEVVTEDLPEHAAWTTIARVLMNLHETITRN